ncbi:hypothetical protein [Streptomyces calidiresistens]
MDPPGEPGVGWVPYEEVDAEAPPEAYDEPWAEGVGYEEVAPACPVPLAPLTPWYPPMDPGGDAGEICDTGVAWVVRDGAGAAGALLPHPPGEPQAPEEPEEVGAEAVKWAGAPV